MPKKEQTIKEKLTKYKISGKRYNNESASLQAAGFTQPEADKIILRLSSKKSVESVLMHHSTLKQEPYNLSHNQIFNIASKGGGAQAIKAVLKYFTNLQELGLNKEEIVDIASNSGGARAINTVLSSYEQLQKIDCSKQQIVDMASNAGGAQAIKTVLNSYESLQELSFSKEQIIDMASYRSGAQLINTVLIYSPELARNDYSLDLITSLSACKGGNKTMNRIKKRGSTAIVGTKTQSDTPETAESSYTLSLGNLQEINNTNFILFDCQLSCEHETLIAAQNSVTSMDFGLFANNSSVYQHEIDDNSQENHCRKLLKEK